MRMNLRELPMLVVLCSSLFVPGCADITAARRAQDPASAGPGERTVRASEVGLGAGSTLGLSRGLEIALECNPSVTISRARASAALAQLRQVIGGYYPQVTLTGFFRLQQSGGGSSSSGFSGSGGSSSLGMAETNIETQNGTLTLNQLLFDFGRTNALNRQSTELFIAALADLEATVNDVAFAYRQSFFNVLKQQELLRVAEESVRQFEKRLEQVKALIEAGRRIQYDRTKAEVDLGNAQLNVVKARTALTVAKATLNNALGLAEIPEYAIEKPKSEEEWTAGFEESLGKARLGHPRLWAQIYREQAAVYAIDAGIAGLFPQLTMQSSGSLSGTLTPPSWSAFAGPLLNWILFNGWANTERVKELVADLRAARATRAQLEQQIFLDLRQAFALLEDAKERLRIVSLTVKSAEQSLNLVQELFGLGRASSVDLTDAQVALSTAKGDQIQALFDVQIAIATLRRSAGYKR